MTKSEFEAAYAARSNASAAEIFEPGVYVALPCNCGEEDCQGWAAVFDVPRHIKQHTDECDRRYVESIKPQRLDNDRWVVSALQVWVPGIYDSKDTAVRACDYDDGDLQRLQNTVNPDGCITMAMLDTLTKP